MYILISFVIIIVLLLWLAERMPTPLTDDQRLYRGSDDICYFHCHTTGLDSQDDRIVQFACIRYKKNPISMKFEREVLTAIVRSGRESTPEALRIHRIRYDRTFPENEFSSYCKELNKFVGNRRVIVHFASFTRAFVKAEYSRAGYATLKLRIADLVDLLEAKNIPSGPYLGFKKLLKHFRIEVRGSDSVSIAHSLADICEKTGLFESGSQIRIRSSKSSTAIAILFSVFFFGKSSEAKVTGALSGPLLGEVACRVDTDCVLVSHPCEGKEAVNTEFKAVAEKRILESSKKRSCPQVSYQAYKQKTKATYEAVCVNRVCQSRQVSQ